MTFRSFGEMILISVVAARENGAELTIQSKPRFSDTTADYGKNYENVERIVAYLADRYPVELVSANNSCMDSSYNSRLIDR